MTGLNKVYMTGYGCLSGSLLTVPTSTSLASQLSQEGDALAGPGCSCLSGVLTLVPADQQLLLRARLPVTADKLVWTDSIQIRPLSSMKLKM